MGRQSKILQVSQDIPTALPPIGHAITGALGGVFALSCVYPLDIAKTRLQVQSKENTETKYAGTFDAIKTILKEEGILGLYKGLRIGLINIVATNFTYFYWYNFLKPFYEKKGKMNTLMQLIMGAHAGVLTQLLVLPLSVVMTRIQTRKEKKGIIESMMEIIQKEGFQGLYAGILPAMILTINPSISFTVFEKMKTMLERYYKTTKLSAFQLFIIGMIAKTIATIVTYPYIVSKVRLMWRSKESNELQYKGIFDVFQKIWKDEGFWGFYKGLSTQISKAVLSQALIFMVKEKLAYYTLLAFQLYYIKKLKA